MVKYNALLKKHILLSFVDETRYWSTAPLPASPTTKLCLKIAEKLSAEELYISTNLKPITYVKTNKDIFHYHLINYQFSCSFKIRFTH